MSDRTRMMLRWIRRALIALALFFVVALPAYVHFALRPLGVGPDLLTSDARMRVDHRADALAPAPRPLLRLYC